MERSVRPEQEISARFGLVPTYVIDHPIATTAISIEVLRGLRADGRCQIGAHLHAWVNPPQSEPVNAILISAISIRRWSSKIEALTTAIATAFGSCPVIYKAGRYSVRPATTQILHDLGYLIDLSVMPHTDFRDDGGPDFQGCPDRPYWFGPGDQSWNPRCGLAFTLLPCGPGGMSMSALPRAPRACCAREPCYHAPVCWNGSR